MLRAMAGVTTTWLFQSYSIGGVLSTDKPVLAERDTRWRCREWGVEAQPHGAVETARRHDLSGLREAAE